MERALSLHSRFTARHQGRADCCYSFEYNEDDRSKPWYCFIGVVDRITKIFWICGSFMKPFILASPVSSTAQGHSTKAIFTGGITGVVNQMTLNAAAARKEITQKVTYIAVVPRRLSENISTASLQLISSRNA